MQFSSLPLSASMLTPSFMNNWGATGNGFFNPMQSAQLNPITVPTFGSILPGTGGPGSGNEPASQGWWGIDGLGKNLDTLKLGLGGLQTGAQLWGAFQAQRLARDQFDYTKRITDTNLTNSTNAYNTALEDRARSRGAVEGQTQTQVNDYIERNRARIGK